MVQLNLSNILLHFFFLFYIEKLEAMLLSNTNYGKKKHWKCQKKKLKETSHQYGNELNFSIFLLYRYLTIGNISEHWITNELNWSNMNLKRRSLGNKFTNNSILNLKKKKQKRRWATVVINMDTFGPWVR